MTRGTSDKGTIEKGQAEKSCFPSRWPTILPVHMHVMAAEIEGDKELEEDRVRRICR
jgi:hypothetical protein